MRFSGLPGNSAEYLRVRNSNSQGLRSKAVQIPGNGTSSEYSKTRSVRQELFAAAPRFGALPKASSHRRDILEPAEAKKLFASGTLPQHPGYDNRPSGTRSRSGNAAESARGARHVTPSDRGSRERPGRSVRLDPDSRDIGRDRSSPEDRQHPERRARIMRGTSPNHQRSLRATAFIPNDTSVVDTGRRPAC